MKRRGFALLILVACAAAGLLAALGAVPSAATAAAGQTTTPPTTTVQEPPAPNTIPAGVTIAGQVFVGGLSPADATLAVREFFAQPLFLRVGKVTMRVTAKKLGWAAYVGDAVKRARITRPGGNVPLKVRAPLPRAKRYVERLAERFDRQSRDAVLSLRNGKPHVTKDRTGRRLKRVAVTRGIFRSFKTLVRVPIEVRFDTLKPKVTRKGFGDVIVIDRGDNRLRYYVGTKLRRTFGVATGQAQYPTPLGHFEIVVKWRHPWWYPPASDWAKDAEPIPPGPGNPLGTRWMGISSPAVGIHGTPDAASIGYSASHGCIRMLIPEVEWLFEQVEIGTPVFIVP